VHQYHADAGAMQKADVVREFDKSALSEYFSAKGKHEGLPAECVEIRGNRAKPADELGGRGRHDCRS